PYSTTSTSVGAGPYGLDGSNTVTVWAEDGAGNLSVQSSSTFVYHAPQGPAHITVDKSILEFAAAPEGILPDTQWVTIANSGGGALRLTIHADSSWITVGPYTTWYTNYVRLPLVINTTSMPETTYTASVTIVSGAADNSPFVIPISYVVTRNYLSDGCLEDPQTVASVQQAGQHYLYAGRLKISADKTWSCDGGHNCTARGHVNINGILGFEGDLSVNTSSGRIRGNGAVTVLNRNGSTLATLWQGEIDFTAQDVILKGLIGPDRYSRLKIAGLQVELGEISLLPDGVGIAGKLVFPNLGKTKLSITNIQVTQSSGIRLAGEFSPPPLSIGGLTLKDMRLSFNTITNSFGGSVNVEVPKLVTVGGTVGIVNGSLNTIGLQVNLSQGIPIDATGLSLSGGSGLLDHISDGKGLLISLTVDIKGVYSVAGYDVFKFDDVGVTVEPPSKFSVGGSFRVFNLPVARGSGVYDRGVINTSFKVNLLNGVFDGDFNASLSKGRISGSATGTLKTPSNLPLILKPLQNKKIASASAQFQNANLSGDIQGCLFRRCVKATWKLEYAGNGVIKYCFPCNITTFTQKFMRTAPRDGVYYAFDVEPGSGEIWFSIRSESGIAPGYELIDPSGHSIDSSTAQFIRSDEDSAAVYIVTAPAGGTWQIHVRDYGSAVLTPEAMRFHVQPQITILEPSAPTNSTVIRWMDSDPERSAEINFYYDSDNSNFDGSPITVEPIRSHDSLGSLSWDVSSLSAGDYYIYAVIADSFSAPYAVYAPGIVTIPSSSVPTPPQGFQAVPTDTSIVLGWNRVSDSVIGYVVHYSEDTSSLSLESVIGVDDTDLVEITALKPGRTYKLAISALDSIGNQSQLSNSVIVPFKVVGSNNPPCITSPAPGTRAIAGRPYYAALSAADMDNDVISFVADSVPSGMGVTANSIQWTPDTSQTGPVAVRILASDGNGGTDTLEFTINVIDEASLVGSIGFNRSLYIGKDEQMIVSVVDVDRDMDLGHVDSVMVSVTSTSDVAGFPMWLRETSAHSGQFSGDIGFDVYASNMMQHKIKVQSPDTVFVRYVDTDPAIVVYASGAWENGTCCTGTTGNVNSQGGVDLADLSALVSYLTGGGLSLTCNPEANVNGSGAVDLADLSALVSYLTGGGYVLPSCP
ncbi:MAG: fibronectin type III domain-containing protein, partial [Candidatus Zixiibacteriota bacterium]